MKHTRIHTFSTTEILSHTHNEVNLFASGHAHVCAFTRTAETSDSAADISQIGQEVNTTLESCPWH